LLFQKNLKRSFTPFTGRRESCKLARVYNEKKRVLFPPCDAGSLKAVLRFATEIVWKHSWSSSVIRKYLMHRFATKPLSLREVRRRCHECPVDIRAVERARVIFVRPGGNTGVRGILNSPRKYPPLIPRLRGGRLYPSPGGRRDSIFDSMTSVFILNLGVLKFVVRQARHERKVSLFSTHRAFALSLSKGERGVFQQSVRTTSWNGTGLESLQPIPF